MCYLYKTFLNGSMKILMTDVNGPVSGARGANLIAALLKRCGHEVVTVTLTDNFGYSRDTIYKLKGLIEQTELVMISVFSFYVIRAIDITKMVKEIKPDIKVVWGGPHCFAEPELSTEYADIVCYGEGEPVVCDLAERIERGVNYDDIPNLDYHGKDKSRESRAAPLIDDLDSLPCADNDLFTHYILSDDLYRATDIDMGGHFSLYPFGEPTLTVLTSRGCPHKCSYCNNIRYIKIYGKNTLRFRSVSHFVGELKALLKVYTCCSKILFGDDDFLIRKSEDLREFADIYKREINLPFAIEMSANTFNAEKTDILLDAGLKVIELGIQSASERVLKDVYNRNISINKAKKTVHLLAPYVKNSQLDVLADFIVDNPYEREEDIYCTLSFMLDLPESFKLNIFNLAFYPGTPIYTRAVNDGFIKPQDYSAYRAYDNTPDIYQNNFATWLIRKFQKHRNTPGFMKFLIRFLASKRVYPVGSVLFPLIKRLIARIGY